jgi:triosephosphate isomerase
MVRTVIAGNWKMNKTGAEAVDFATRLRAAYSTPPVREVIIAPPFTALQAVAEAIRGSFIQLSAQNLHEAEKGAYTGEISSGMLREAGCTHVIIGHSERRTLFTEGNDRINRKDCAKSWPEAHLLRWRISPSTGRESNGKGDRGPIKRGIE